MCSLSLLFVQASVAALEAGDAGTADVYQFVARHHVHEAVDLRGFSRDFNNQTPVGQVDDAAAVDVDDFLDLGTFLFRRLDLQKQKLSVQIRILHEGNRFDEFLLGSLREDLIEFAVVACEYQGDSGQLRVVGR